MMDFPLAVFAISFLVLWLSEHAGASLRKRMRNLEQVGREDLGVILSATLTLLGLIIGFSFSMAVNRYDQRKNLEEAEANAIGTEYFRAGLLPASDAEKVRQLLTKYLNERYLFYTTRSGRKIEDVNASTTREQVDLWAAIQSPALAQPTPLMAQVVIGMNDVLNAQGYTQAAWRNRLPVAAWVLMGAIAACCNILLGYTLVGSSGGIRRFVVLPVLVSLSFALIADLDSPRGGIIRVSPQNLIALSHSL